MNLKLEKIEIFSYVLIYVITWVLIKFIASPNLDLYGDMLENFAWSQTIEWGTYKHPPFFSWVVAVWFRIFPKTNVSYYLLSYVNSGIGLIGIYYLCRAFGLRKIALASALLMAFALPYSTLAGKFNANSILLSLWPWTCWAYIKSINSNKSSGFIYSALLSLLGTICILGKYYSLVFLFSLFLVSLLNKNSRSWYFTYKPYLVVFLSVGLLTPHLIWLVQHDFVTLKYVADQGTENISYKSIRNFMCLPVLFWLIPLSILSLLISKEKKSVISIFKVFIFSWFPKNTNDQLFYIAILPWFISLLFGIFAVVQLSSPWAIPIGFCYTILWLRNNETNVNDRAHKIIKIIFFIGLFFSFFLSFAYGKWQSHINSKGYYLPREEMSKIVNLIWQQKYSKNELRWIGGAWPENAAIAFYGENRARVIPDLPDTYPATINPVINWEKEAGIFVCPAVKASKEYENELKPCVSKYKEWIKSKGKKPEIIYLKARKEGWRFTNNIFFNYAVVIYIP